MVAAALGHLDAKHRHTAGFDLVDLQLRQRRQLERQNQLEWPLLHAHDLVVLAALGIENGYTQQTRSVKERCHERCASSDAGGVSQAGIGW